MTPTTIQALARAIEAEKACARPPVNAFGLELHRATIERCMETAPHGSGIDGEVTIDRDRSTATKVVFNVPYHRMDENGFYDGWEIYRVTIRPTFDGIDVAVTGRGDEGTKNWIADCFRLLR